MLPMLMCAAACNAAAVAALTAAIAALGKLVQPPLGMLDKPLLIHLSAAAVAGATCRRIHC
jgi:hypothetical protein